MWMQNVRDNGLDMIRNRATFKVTIFGLALGSNGL